LINYIGGYPYQLESYNSTATGQVFGHTYIKAEVDGTAVGSDFNAESDFYDVLDDTEKLLVVKSTLVRVVFNKAKNIILRMSIEFPKLARTS
jgi:hypothetical protein